MSGIARRAPAPAGGTARAARPTRVDGAAPGRLRVAMLSEHASPLAALGGEDAGGQNVYVAALARHLALRGLAVDVFTRRDAADLPATVALVPGVRVVHLTAGPAAPLPKDALWPLMPAFRDAFLRFAATTEARYDVLHSHFWLSGWVAVELRRLLGLPVVQIFHALGATKRREQGGNDGSPPERLEVERRVVREADALIAQCPSERAELISDYGADPDRIALVPGGVDLTLFRPLARAEARWRLGLPVDGPLAVYVGRLVARKDVGNVVRALARLGPGPVGAVPRLLVVGGAGDAADPVATPEIGVLRRLAEELGVAGRVQFAGRRPSGALRDYYCAGDVAVTTPWYEPFGLTPLEAMACGRPVVGSAVGGLTFTIRDGETGFLVPPRDPVALAERLARLWADPALAAGMGAAARRHVERHFPWSATAAAVAGLYAAVRAAGRRSERTGA